MEYPILHYSNLEYVSDSGNKRHAINTGLWDTRIKVGYEKAREIRELRNKGISRKEVAEKYGVSKRTIRLIEIGASWNEKNLVDPNREP